jgi:AcrR family transcriptional regulator
MTVAKSDRALSLDAKYRPSTEAAKATFNAILKVTGELLSDTGFERLSTNMVAAKAGLSPPALYRYFPNKYALLAELGRSLMAAQDVEVLSWYKNLPRRRPDLEERVVAQARMMKRNVEITLEMPGGAWIMRALRAVPILQAVRIESRDMVAETLYKSIRPWYPKAAEADFKLWTRMSIEMAYSAIEMVVQEPDLDAEKVFQNAAKMIELYFETLI